MINKMKQKIITYNIESLFVFIMLFLGIVITVIYIFKFDVLFNSDAAGANMYAREQLFEKRLFPKDWVYLQDIWVVFINNLIIPINWVFKNEVLSRFLAIFIQSGLLAISIISIFKKMKMKKAGWLFLSIIFSGVSYTFIDAVFGNSSYGNYLLWTIISITITFCIMDSTSKKTTYMYSFCLLSLLVILQMMGSRFLVFLIIPLIGALTSMKLIEVVKNNSSLKNYFVVIVTILFSVLFAFYFNKEILNEIQVIKAASNPVFVDADKVVLNLKLYFLGLLELFGAFQTNRPLMSVYGFSAIYRTIMIVLIMIVIPVAMFLKYKIISNYTRLLLFFYLINFFITSYTYIFSTIAVDLTSSRYFISSLFVAIILSVIYLQQFVFKYSNLGKTLVLVSLIPFYLSSFFIENLSHIYSFNKEIQTIESKHNKNQELASYLMKKGLQFGYASYWNSEVISVLSNFKVEVAPINLDPMSPFQFLSSKRWYVSNYKNSSFILLDGNERKLINTNKMFQLVGSPKETLEFNEYEIFIYDYNISSKLIDFPFMLGEEKSISAKNLLSQTGGIVGETLVANEGSDKNGFLTYGPYVKLGKGKYQVNVVYNANGKANEQVGNWDIGFSLPDRWVKEATGVFEKAENGQPNTASYTIEINDQNNNYPLEVRSYYNGVGRLIVEKITFIKISGG